MSGSITLFRVSNPTGAQITSGTMVVNAGQQIVFPEGQVGGITLGLAGFRGPSSSSGAGSVAGPKARIISANVANISWNSPTAASGLVLELGKLDNDGYFTAHLSSAS